MIRVETAFLGKVADVWYLAWLAKNVELQWNIFIEKLCRTFRGVASVTLLSNSINSS